MGERVVLWPTSRLHNYRVSSSVPPAPRCPVPVRLQSCWAGLCLPPGPHNVGVMITGRRAVNSQREVLLTVHRASPTSLHLVFARPLVWVVQVSSPLLYRWGDQAGVMAARVLWVGRISGVGLHPLTPRAVLLTPALARDHGPLAALGAGDRGCRVGGKGQWIIQHHSWAIHEPLWWRKCWGCLQGCKWKKNCKLPWDENLVLLLWKLRQNPSISSPTRREGEEALRLGGGIMIFPLVLKPHSQSAVQH